MIDNLKLVFNISFCMDSNETIWRKFFCFQEKPLKVPETLLVLKKSLTTSGRSDTPLVANFFGTSKIL